MYQKVADTLNKLGTPFQIVEHEPALTTKQVDCFTEGMKGVHTKTIFIHTQDLFTFLKAIGYEPHMIEL